MSACPKCGTRVFAHRPGSAVRKRRKLLQAHRVAQDNRCCWCDCEMSDVFNAPNFATLEHLIKVSDGGDDTMENTKAACYFCNIKRHERELTTRTIAAWESLAEAPNQRAAA